MSGVVKALRDVIGGGNLGLFKKILFIFREKGREGERESNISVWLPLTLPLLETWPTTQACALTGD